MEKRDSRPILVVDCELDMAEALARSIEAMGYPVLVAYDGESAIATAQRSNPFLVLFEVDLPDMAGAALAKRLRDYPELDSTALASLSNGELPQRSPNSKSVGSIPHFVKPIECSQLEELIAVARNFRAGRKTPR